MSQSSKRDDSDSLVSSSFLIKSFCSIGTTAACCYLRLERVLLWLMMHLLNQSSISYLLSNDSSIHSMKWNEKKRNWRNCIKSGVNLSLVGTPAAQVHNSSQGLLWLLGFFMIPQFAWSHCRWLWRDLLGLRQRPHVMFSMLLCWSHDTVPPAYSLILQCLHHSNTGCHTPCPSTARWTTHCDLVLVLCG